MLLRFSWLGNLTRLGLGCFTYATQYFPYQHTLHPTSVSTSAPKTAQPNTVDAQHVSAAIFMHDFSTPAQLSWSTKLLDEGFEAFACLRVIFIRSRTLSSQFRQGQFHNSNLDVTIAAQLAQDAAAPVVQTSACHDQRHSCWRKA